MTLAVATIILVFIVSVLIATNKIKPQHYIYCVAAISLGLVYQTTMLGIYTVGSDIQRELFYSKEALANGWNPALTGVNQSNTSIVVGILAPLLSKLSHIDLIWIYKAILPLFLVATPVILFYAFKKQIGDLRAYFATLFFMIMPVFSLEIAQIAKSMVAEFFFALMILAMVSNWRWQWKSLGMGGNLLMSIFCHYTVGVIALCYLLAILIIRLAAMPINWKLLFRKTVPIGVIAGVFLLGTGAFYFYYNHVQGGYILSEVTRVAQSYKGKVQTIGDEWQMPSTLSSSLSPSQIALGTQIPGQLQYLQAQPLLVKTAIGLDFVDASPLGKVFRIILYFTELLIAAGAVFLLFSHKRYKFSAEFIACIGASFILLLCCIFIPGFSASINMTRFYHMSLFFLAPVLVLGTDCIAEIAEIRFNFREK